MHITIVFDKRNSMYEGDFEYRKVLVKAQLMYLNERYITQGYLYANTVYERLGLKWNACNENGCWVYKRDGELEITITPDELSDKIWIDISNDK